MFRRKPSEPPPPAPAVRVMPLYDPPPRAAARALEPVTARPSPVAVMLASQFDSKEWGYGVGARIVPRNDPPPPPASPAFVIEPPPWAGIVGAQPLPEPDPLSPAEMAAEALAKLKEAIGDQAEPRFTPGPPAHLEPLPRFQGVDVDWNEVEREAIAENKRSQLEHARKLLAEHEEPTPKPDYPAPKRSLVQPVAEPEPGQLRPQIPAPPWKDSA